MKQNSSADVQTILFGVTSSQSLKLLGKLPQAMGEAGWNVHVVAGSCDYEAPRDLEGLNMHTIQMSREPSPARDLKSLVRWIRLLRWVKPGVVVIGTPKAAFLGLTASLICRIPIRIYQLRGLRLQTVSTPLRGLLAVFEWVTSRISTEVLAVSISLQQEYCQLGLASAKKVQVIGLGSSHGVDTELFRPDRARKWELLDSNLQAKVDSTAPVIGFVGRFSRDKGSRELVACSRDLARTGIFHTLLLVGPIEGDQGVLEELDTSTCRVIQVGNVEDVAPYYSMMDLLVLPTHREGFPNAVLEAASSGIPTVTTDATGAVDSVLNGYTGYIVPARDHVALTEAVKTLIQDSKLRSDLGKNARNWVVSHFDSAVVTKKHVEYLVSRGESIRRGG